MTLTLARLIFLTLAELGQADIRTATGGSTTTLVDSTLGTTYEDTDSLVGGAVYISYDAAGANGAPQGEYKKITDYDPSNGTLTFTAMTVAPASGDEYFLSLPAFPVDVVKERVNAGLRMLGQIPLIDKTTLDTVSGQSEYSQSLTWKYAPPLKIEVQTNSTSGDARPELLTGWTVEPTAPGSTGLIRFPYHLSVSKDLYVTYLGIHPTLNLYTDPVSEYVAEELAVAAAAYKVASWYNSRQGGKDAYWLQKVNETQNTYDRTRKAMKPWRPVDQSGYSDFPQV